MHNNIRHTQTAVPGEGPVDDGAFPVTAGLLDEDVTDLLQGWSAGDPEALERLIPLVADELRRLARSYLDKQAPGHTLQPTALVNELYLRLIGRPCRAWPDRGHFFAFAATTMRSVLVDHARARRAAKRGGGAPKVDLDEARDAAVEPTVDVLALDEALRALAEHSVRQSRIVELRAFAGLSLRQTAECLAVSEATISREWSTAKAWLFERLTQPLA